MAQVEFKNVAKVYDNGVRAVNNFSLLINDCDFVVLVGPSGCGKSTALRMLAGLEAISEGDLLIDGERYNEVKPKGRNIAMVFQSYALYPHMTVGQNLAFGLKNRKIARPVIREKIQQAAQMLQIQPYLKRFPRQLSGGQRQRVALGRALVRNPKVFLLDEPLSNLDAKLRGEMRSEITKLHRELGATFVYVTHDQIEALTMGNKIVVMNKGEIQQVGAPWEIYEKPCNLFVATFIGSPQMNLLPVTLKPTKAGNEVYFQNELVAVLAPEQCPNDVSGELILGIRPEHLTLAENTQSGLILNVDFSEDLGPELYVYGTIGQTEVIVKLPGKLAPLEAQTIRVKFDPEAIHLFDPTTSIRVN